MILGQWRGWMRSSFLQRPISTLPASGIFKTLAQHDSTTTAITCSHGVFCYGQLLQDAAALKDRMGKSRDRLESGKIAFMVENSYDYVGLDAR